MREDGSLDLTATQQSLDRLVRGGVSGIVTLPMLGENASLSTSERLNVIEAAKEATGGRVPLLTGLAERSTQDAVASARSFAKLRVDGLMVFPSLGYRSDPRETVEWYRAIAGATNLPIMIYNNPIAYGVDVTPELLEELADIPTIVCVKEECGNVRRITDIYNRVGDRYDVFCGVDDLIVESLALGATGWVSGMTNAWPAECVSLFESCHAGRFAEALGLYRIMTPAFHLDTHVKLVQYIKYAEHLTYGSPEWVRGPRLPLVGEERDRVGAIIEKVTRAVAEWKRAIP
jgi:4-hydroxy-tetrahydrodipicolinate synthase